jgi:hypothetical protein
MQKERSFYYLAVLSIGILLALPGGRAIAAESKPDVVVEGVGEIVSGNTVKARKEAVEGVMRQAMELTLQAQISPDLRATYQKMISNHLVGNYSRYVKNYRIHSERAEGTVYRVRASVVLDEARIVNELKNHGFVRPALLEQTAKPPTVVMFIADRSEKKDEVIHQTWWASDEAKIAFAQDQIRTRLAKSPLQIFSRRRTSSAIEKSGMTSVLERMREAGYRFNQTDLLELSDKIGASYLVFGIVENEFAGCNLIVMQTAERKKVGQLKLSESFFKDRRMIEGSDKLDAVGYELMGLIFKDWVKEWEVDTRLTASFYPVNSIARYRKILSTLAEVKEISEVQESSFSRQMVELRFISRLSSAALSKKLAAISYFRRKASVKSTGPRAIEAVFQ